MNDRIPFGPGVLLWPVILLGGCMATMRPEKKPFTASSADFNGGLLHSTIVAAPDVDAAIKRFTVLAEKRGLVLVGKNNCNASRCELTYKTAGENKSQTKGSTTSTSSGGFLDRDRQTTTHTSSVRTVNLKYSSRFYVYLAATPQGIAIEALGVPVLNTDESCPPALVARNVSCVPPGLWSRPNETLPQSVKNAWGFDVSGRSEAEVITGIFAEF